MTIVSDGIVEKRTQLGLGLGAATLVGVLGALFLAGPALFADGSDQERLVVVVILGFVLGTAGVALGAFAPKTFKLVPLFLAGPTILVSILFGAKDSSILPIALLLVAGSVGFSLIGVRLGARIRRGGDRSSPGP